VVKRGPGLLSVINSNTYAGATLIQAGKLAIYSNAALGSASQGTTVSAGGALMLPGGVNYALPEPLTITGPGPTGQGALENAGGDNVFAGPVTVAGDATIGVTSGKLTVSGGVTLPASSALDKSGAGVLSLRGGIDWGASSLVSVTAGTLRLEPTAGAPVSVSANAPTLMLGPGVARVNAAAQDPFSDDQSSWQRVNIANNVPNGLTIEAGGTLVGHLSGPGSTLVATGAHLVTYRISQSGLSIGAGGRVSLTPFSGTSVINSLLLNAPIAIVPEENVFSLGLGDESSWAPNPVNEISGAIGTVNAIPEPASIALVAGALLFVLAAAACRSMAVARSIGSGYAATNVRAHTLVDPRHTAAR
jgi:autotransporter-associated beta strand protein